MTWTQADPCCGRRPGWAALRDRLAASFGTADRCPGQRGQVAGRVRLVSPDSSSTRGWVPVVLDSTAAAGSTVDLVAGDGSVVATATATATVAEDAQSVVYSSVDVTAGVSCTVTVDGADAGSATAGEAARPGRWAAGGPATADTPRRLVLCSPW
ncbi:hypothetical protein [Modestobacter excelsi]|uniref:hypothetical protein n=1 Tax=Modestobacter excelsi TaxID=2213161 RepID=UPI001C20EAE3|nr:hypothetical protein [Modestobacter excelsi]